MEFLILIQLLRLLPLSAKKSGELLSETRLHSCAISYLAGLPSGRIAIVFSWDERSIVVFDSTDMSRSVATFLTRSKITSLASSPNYDYLAIGHENCLIIWDVYRNSVITTINARESLSSFLHEPANRMSDFYVEELLAKLITHDYSSQFIVWTAQAHLIVGCPRMLVFFDVDTRRCIALITSDHIKHNIVHLPPTYFFRREYDDPESNSEDSRLFIWDKTHKQCAFSWYCKGEKSQFDGFSSSPLYRGGADSIHALHMEDSGHCSTQKAFPRTLSSHSIMPFTVDEENVFIFGDSEFAQYNLKKQKNMNVYETSEEDMGVHLPTTIEHGLLLNNGTIVIVVSKHIFAKYTFFLLQYRCIQDYFNYGNSQYNRLLEHATDYALLPELTEMIRQYTNPGFSQPGFFKTLNREAMNQEKAKAPSDRLCYSVRKI